MLLFCHPSSLVKCLTSADHSAQEVITVNQTGICLLNSVNHFASSFTGVVENNPIKMQ